MSDRVTAIAALRRLRMTGPEIAEVLTMPPSTVSAVLQRIGLGKPRSLEPVEPANRYQRDQPGELAHIDVKKLGRIDRIGHRITGERSSAHARSNWHDGKRLIGWEYVHVCVDDATRLAYVEVLDRRAGPHRRRVPAPRGRVLRLLRHPGPSGDDRQRRRLPLDPARPRLQHPWPAAPSHPALPTPHQRQSRTVHPHPAWRLGIRRHLRHIHRAHGSPPRLARALQSPTTTRQPQSPAAPQTPSATEEQRSWALHLERIRVELACGRRGRCQLRRSSLRRCRSSVGSP